MPTLQKMSHHGANKDHHKESPPGAASAAANGIHPQEHSCEICGMSGLSDDAMREHTRQCHVEGSAQCPFCGLSGVPAAELLLHVNQAHLDYLTPENELMSFIDDQTPRYFRLIRLYRSVELILHHSSIDGDSDSISDCRGLSPSITSELLAPVSNTYTKPGISNGVTSVPSISNSTVHYLNGSSGNSSSNHKICSSMSTSTTSISSKSSIGSQLNGTSSISASSSSNNSHQPVASKSNQQHQLNNQQQPEVTITTSTSNKSCDIINGGKEVIMNGGGAGCTGGVTAGSAAAPSGNGTGAGGQGSPLRSQLGLKLKAHKPIPTITTKPSPLQCLLCPYTTENPTVLEEHINRSHFDPLSPSVNNGASGNSHVDTLSALQCPICARTFESGSDLELHVNIEHRDILSPAKADRQNGGTPAAAAVNGSLTGSLCPVCGISFDNMKTADMEIHIEKHFSKSPQNPTLQEPDLGKQAQKLREQREFEMLRAQYGMDDQGNFREQSAAAMQRAVYAGEMSVADYYERQVGLRAAESHGVDDGSSCTKSVSPRVLALSSSSPNVLKTYLCSSVDHYASSYGDKGWGCGYRNLQMMLSSLLQVGTNLFEK